MKGRTHPLTHKRFDFVALLFVSSFHISIFLVAVHYASRMSVISIYACVATFDISTFDIVLLFASVRLIYVHASGSFTPTLFQFISRYCLVIKKDDTRFTYI